MKFLSGEITKKAMELSELLSEGMEGRVAKAGTVTSRVSECVKKSL